MNNLTNIKPYLLACMMQFCIAGMAIFAKFALTNGMDHYVFIVYRHAIATAVLTPLALFLERDRPKLSLSVLWKILLLGLLEPVIDQNLYYIGMKYTTPAFTSALSNISPTLTFLMALAFRQEKIQDGSIHNLSKIVGSLVAVGGILTMVLVKGPMIGTGHPHTHDVTEIMHHEYVKGTVFILLGSSAWSSFVFLQAKTIAEYPSQLSLTAMICAAGALEGVAVVLLSNRVNSAAWIMHLDSKLLCAIYSGTVCSGLAYYVQGMIVKMKGAVFATSFGPLNMLLVGVVSVGLLHETLLLGRVIGGIIIAIGLYLVLWGKSRDPVQTGPDQNQEELVHV